MRMDLIILMLVGSWYVNSLYYMTVYIDDYTQGEGEQPKVYIAAQGKIMNFN